MFLQKKSTRSGKQDNDELGGDKTDDRLDSAFEIESDEDHSNQSDDSTEKLGFGDEVLKCWNHQRKNSVMGMQLLPGFILLEKKSNSR